MDFPLKPNDSECCGSGCTPCIFDIYEEQLKKYNKKTPSTKNEKNCMSPTSYTIFKIINIEKITSDSFLYTFKYLRKNIPDFSENNLCLYNPGQHFLLRGESEKLENKYFTRAYTPIPNTKFEQDTFTILIKFYDNGLMSKYLKKLEINSETFWRGPYGNYKINYTLKNILMICQGTGVAPFYSIIHDYINNENCETFIKLFYCCRNLENIYLRDEIYGLTSYWNFTCTIFLSRNLSQVTKKYNEEIHCRYLNENDLLEYFQSKNDKTNVEVLICGNDTFNKNIYDYIINSTSDICKELIHVF